MPNIKEPLKQNLTIVNRRLSRPQCHYISFGGLEGWAQVTIDDELGFVNVQSDWLDGSYCWPRRNLPGSQSPSEFLASFADKGKWGCDYLANKLFAMQRDEWLREDTKDAFKEAIIEARRGQDIDADEARDCWDALDRVEENHVPDELMRFNDDWQCMIRGPTMQFLVMRDRVLPLLAQTVKEHLQSVDSDTTG